MERIEWLEGIKELKELKRTIAAEIERREGYEMFGYMMSEEEIADYRKKHGDYDFVIGNWGVKRVHGREDEKAL